MRTMCLLELKYALIVVYSQELRGQLGRERDALRHASLQKEIEERELRTKIEKTVCEMNNRVRSTFLTNFILSCSPKIFLKPAKRSLLLRLTENISWNASTTYPSKCKRQRRNSLYTNEELSLLVRVEAWLLLQMERTRNSLKQNSPSFGENQISYLVSEGCSKMDISGALKAAEVDLSTAKGHVTQFQEISQASEAALAALSATHDEYKAATEAQIATLEVHVRILALKNLH